MCSLLYVVLDVLNMSLDVLDMLYVLVVVCGAQDALHVTLCLLLSMLDMLHVCVIVCCA